MRERPASAPMAVEATNFRRVMGLFMPASQPYWMLLGNGKLSRRWPTGVISSGDREVGGGGARCPTRAASRLGTQTGAVRTPRPTCQKLYRFITVSSGRHKKRTVSWRYLRLLLGFSGRRQNERKKSSSDLVVYGRIWSIVRGAVELKQLESRRCT